MSDLLRWRQRIGSGVTQEQYEEQVRLLPQDEQAVAKTLYNILDEQSILAAIISTRPARPQLMTIPQARQDG